MASRNAQAIEAGPRHPSDLSSTWFNQPSERLGLYRNRANEDCLCSCRYGPRQSKNIGYSERGRLNVQVKFSPFSCKKRRAPIRDAEDRSIAVLIHQSLVSSIRLELFPKSTIDVFLTIIENDGIDSCVAAGTVAASTALADAGIEMLGLVISCAATLMDEEIWLDPNHDEATAGAGTLVLACMPALNVVTNVWQNGTMPPKQGIECMMACLERCATMHSIVAQSLVSNSIPE